MCATEPPGHRRHRHVAGVMRIGVLGIPPAARIGDRLVDAIGRRGDARRFLNVEAGHAGADHGAVRDTHRPSRRGRRRRQQIRDSHRASRRLTHTFAS
jgi:hypothetical protein